jgi:hypothetical protein
MLMRSWTWGNPLLEVPFANKMGAVPAIALVSRAGGAADTSDSQRALLSILVSGPRISFMMKSSFFPQDQPARTRKIISASGRSFADLPM